VSSESDSESERKEVKSQKESDKTVRNFALTQTLTNQSQSTPAASQDMSDADVTAAFTKFYMQRSTTEFSEDLDRIRVADDFKDDALPLLINALQQGTSLFSIEDQRRVVMAGMRKDEKKAGD
jgi:ribosome assembly protein 3